MSDQGTHAPTAGLPPAGWYDDPNAPGVKRWWSGVEWTAHTQQVQSSPPDPVASSVMPPVVAAPSVARWDGVEASNRPAKLALTFGLVALIVFFAVQIPTAFFPMPGLTNLASLVTLAFGTTALVLGVVGTARSGRIGAGRRQGVWGIVVGALAVVIAGFAIVAAVQGSGPRLDVPALESQIESGLLDQTGETVTVVCPTDPPAARGSVFECVATDSTGTNWLVEVRIQDDRGSAVWQVQ